jgi:D-psicose/D-tagatose/L-ribulose 3-epimerase
METQLKFGIYYSYWEQEWSADCLKYVERVAKLGFDVIEIAAHHLNTYNPAHIAEVGRSARDNGIAITAGLGPSQQRNLSSADPAIRKAGRAFFEETLTNLAKLDIRVIGGALHSYWPIDYSKPVDKAGDRARGLEGISSLADFAGNLGINLCLEVLNRFENHVLNTAEEGVAFVREVGKPNVKVMLDTFHMNIEEDSFGKAIRTAGSLLGHFHTGENNRRVPGKGGLPWHEIGTALREIGYDGAVVMEPFVKMGGQVGADIRVWRDLSDNADEAQMDEAARQALAFSRFVIGGAPRRGTDNAGPPA